MENKTWAVYYRDHYIVVSDTKKLCEIIGKDAGKIHKVVPVNCVDISK